MYQDHSLYRSDTYSLICLQKPRPTAEKEPSPPAAAASAVSKVPVSEKPAPAIGETRPLGAEPSRAVPEAESAPTLDDIYAQYEQLMDVLREEGQSSRPAAAARNDSPAGGSSAAPAGGSSVAPAGGSSVAPAGDRSSAHAAPQEARAMADAAQNTGESLLGNRQLTSGIVCLILIPLAVSSYP